MTIKELRTLIKKLPDDMQVMMPFHEDDIVTVCKELSEVEDLKVTEVDGLEPFDVTVLLLRPCTCHVEKEVDTSHVDKAETLN